MSPPSLVARTSRAPSFTTTPRPETAAPGHSPTWMDDEREATWRERALNAEDALNAAHTEILAQRTRIGELLVQRMDLEAEWTEEAIQRITTENTALKQRVRQLAADNLTLDERLKAAGSNLRSRTGAWPTLQPALLIRDQRPDPDH